MKFVGHEGINAAFDRLLGTSRLYCAVAFWGVRCLQAPAIASAGPRHSDNLQPFHGWYQSGRDSQNGRGWRAGAQQIDTLHAKVYLGDAEMLVTSANASINGLGFEGAVQGNWIEAGVIGPVQDLALDWFKDLWSVSRPITEEDLALATVKWSQRQAYLSTPVALQVARSFGDFDLACETLPLVEWYDDGADWTENRTAIAQQAGTYDDQIEERLGDSFDIAGPEDYAALKPGTWVLRWRRSKNGRVGKLPLEWVQVGDQRLAKAYSYDDDPNEFMDVILPAENPSPQPFNAVEPRFHSAFARALWRPEFADLRSSHYEGCWNTPQRLALLPSFWREVKAVYLSTTK